MLRSYWGVIALAITLGAGQVEAQQQRQTEPSSQATSDSRESSRAAFPVVIVQGDDEASHEQEREQSADKHDAADLLAQQQAASAALISATATEGQLGPVWASVYLSAVAAILSAIARGVTGWAAWRTDRTSRDELRAYIALTPNFCSSFDSTNHCRTGTQVKNVGNTPAKNVHLGSRVVLIRNFDGTPKPPGPEMDPDMTGVGVLGFALSKDHNVTHNRHAERPFTQEEITGIRSKYMAIGLIVRATYEDVFGQSHVEQIGAIVTTEDDETLVKLTSNYLPKDLKLSFMYIANYGEST